MLLFQKKKKSHYWLRTISKIFELTAQSVNSFGGPTELWVCKLQNFIYCKQLISQDRPEKKVSPDDKKTKEKPIDDKKTKEEPADDKKNKEESANDANIGLNLL